MTEPSPTSVRPRRPAWVRLVAVAAVVLALLVAGVLAWWISRDGPDEFTAADRDALIDTAAGDGDAAVDVADVTSWVATDASQVGYRVEEVLFGVDTTAVGRTNQVTGTLKIDGTRVTATAFEVDVASIESDDGRRDDQFRGRIMSADEFPTAAFSLTEPIDLGAEPADGLTVQTTAVGALTLRGTTRDVTFDVDAKLDNGLIGVQGSIPVAFADYGIANPSFGGITTEDVGVVEFVLVFAPA
jgi:polyisoprenoid-binding protein YceI